MKSWPFLQSGDRVDIVAPASHGPRDRLEKGIQWLKAAGLKVHVPDQLIEPDLFFASDLKTQLLHFKEALYSEGKAIWCLRGGYGGMRLIPHLKKIKPPTKPKLFVGYSDATALHLFLQQEWKWPTLHARNIGQLDLESPATDLTLLRDLILRNKTKLVFDGLQPLNAAARQRGMIEAPLTGGNLKLLQCSIGTSWEMKCSGKILFMEDVGERGYAVHRMLEQLRQAKLLRPKALVLGDFTEGEEKDGKDLTMAALERIADEVDFPVVTGLPCGHHPDRNSPLPFGIKAALKLGSKAQLTSVC
jgi:muramoyltetrapeptide carboxypeptidase